MEEENPAAIFYAMKQKYKNSKKCLLKKKCKGKMNFVIERNKYIITCGKKCSREMARITELPLSETVSGLKKKLDKVKEEITKIKLDYVYKLEPNMELFEELKPYYGKLIKLLDYFEKQRLKIKIDTNTERNENIEEYIELYNSYKNGNKTIDTIINSYKTNLAEISEDDDRKVKTYLDTRSKALVDIKGELQKHSKLSNIINIPTPEEYFDDFELNI
jgi:hypothetical protein